MTTMQQLEAAQESPEVVINENFQALSAAAIFSKRHAVTTGLTWGYHGGLYNGNTISDGTVTLTNAADNYVVVLRSTGVVSVSTSSTNSLDPLYAKLYKLTTAGSVVTVEVDQRQDANGLCFNVSSSSVGDMVLASVQTVTGAKTFGSAGAVSKLKIAGTTSGAATLDAAAVAGTAVITLPAATGTLMTSAEIAAAYQTLDADLTTIAGLTATTDNFMQAKSSAWASRTPAQVTTDLQGTGLDVDAVGFRGVPQNAQSGNYTTVAADAGKHLFHASGAGSGDTFTIDSNANVAYELGTAITFVNLDSNVLTIAITSDTMRLAPAGTTGSRQLAQYGIATAIKVGSTEWIISGSGIA